MALEPRRRKQHKKQEGAHLVGTGPSFFCKDPDFPRFSVSISPCALL